MLYLLQVAFTRGARRRNCALLFIFLWCAMLFYNINVFEPLAAIFFDTFVGN